MTRHIVVGGGIIGLATARALTGLPGAEVVLLEKEDGLAAHQTGRNSGVIHAGVYYRPGSLKAAFSRRGRASMLRFCQEHGIEARVCGKLVVATAEDELPRLRALHERALANGLPVRLLDPAQARELEPEVACVAAMHVPTTGVVDYGKVSRTLAALAVEAGADVWLGSEVVGVRATSSEVVVTTTRGEVHGDVLVNCAGLHSDSVARLAGLDPPARIVPFRGEYYELREERRHLVRALIYPVPDPRFPFLGVHLTRGIDGSVHCGPNAVLALAREGYTWRDVRVRDVRDVATYGGFWRLAGRHIRTGAAEVGRSLSKARFARSLARMVPAVQAADLVRAPAGVRAQAITPQGALVDDFLVVEAPRQVHVLNAPSPAATSAFEIAAHITDRVVSATTVRGAA